MNYSDYKEISKILAHGCKLEKRNIIFNQLCEYPDKEKLHNEILKGFRKGLFDTWQLHYTANRLNEIADIRKALSE